MGEWKYLGTRWMSVKSENLTRCCWPTTLHGENRHFHGAVTSHRTTSQAQEPVQCKFCAIAVDGSNHVRSSGNSIFSTSIYRVTSEKSNVWSVTSEVMYSSSMRHCPLCVCILEWLAVYQTMAAGRHPSADKHLEYSARVKSSQLVRNLKGTIRSLTKYRKQPCSF
jgi:hypothetical protein